MVKKVSNYFDWLNIMTYDYFGNWDSFTGVNSPLYSLSSKVADGIVKKYSSEPDIKLMVKNSINKTVSRLIDTGIDKNKIILGVPFYSHYYYANFSSGETGIGIPNDTNKVQDSSLMGPSVQGGDYSYFYIKALLNTAGYVKADDDNTKTPYLYNRNNHIWITYDDANSIKLKVIYALQKHLGGIMIWSVDQDDFKNGYPLLNTIYNQLYQ